MVGVRVRVHHDIGDLANDLTAIAKQVKPDMRKVVREGIKAGNKVAKKFASEQHTMNSDIDVPYQRSFSSEMTGPLEGEYGPVDDGIPHGGSQARGYENGSVNQRPHNNLRRSQDIIGPKFGEKVHDAVGEWFWP